MKFYTYLNELFNRPYKWKIINSSNNELDFHFSSNTSEYEIWIYPDKQGLTSIDLKRAGVIENVNKASSLIKKKGYNWHCYEVGFLILGDDDYIEDIEPQEDYVRIFSTIVDIFKYFIKSKDKIHLIKFSAKEFSRKKLYNRFSRIIQNKTDLKLFTFNEINGDQSYLFISPEFINDLKDL